MILIYLSDDAAFINGDILPIDSEKLRLFFSNNEESISLLLDLPCETSTEKLPSIGATDIKSLLKRKITEKFPSADLVSTKKTKEGFNVIAITLSPSVKGVFNFIEESQQIVTGIYFAPLLLKKQQLDLKATLIVANMIGGGHRMTFFKDGQMIINRTGSFDDDLDSEIDKTMSFVRKYSPDVKLIRDSDIEPLMAVVKEGKARVSFTHRITFESSVVKTKRWLTYLSIAVASLMLIALMFDPGTGNEGQLDIEKSRNALAKKMGPQNKTITGLSVKRMVEFRSVIESNSYLPSSILGDIEKAIPSGLQATYIHWTPLSNKKRIKDIDRLKSGRAITIIFKSTFDQNTREVQLLVSQFIDSLSSRFNRVELIGELGSSSTKRTLFTIKAEQ